MRDAKGNVEKGLITFSTEWCWQRVLRRHRGDGEKERPTRHQLARLLEVLYHASLETEEKRYPKLAAMWLGRKSSMVMPNILAFDQCKKLSESNSTRPHPDLLKTASICESETVFLLVEPENSRSLDLIAWGIADIRGHDGSGGNTIREKLDISQYPDVLTVHFAGPGRFSIRQNGKFTAAYPETGKVEPVGLWERDARFGDVWGSEGGGRTEADDGEDPLKEARIYLVELVVGRLAASGRGGVLLWHSSMDTMHFGGGTCVRVIGGSVDEQIRELVGLDGEEGFRPEAPYRFRELAQWISEIASVDGATVVAKDLVIVRYGAKISTQQNYMKAIEQVCDPETYEWLKPRGTRHRSAAYWVVAEGNQCRSRGQEERPFALVVSADGDANAIFWERNQVRRLPILYRQL